MGFEPPQRAVARSASQSERWNSIAACAMTQCRMTTRISTTKIARRIVCPMSPAAMLPAV